MAAPKPYEQAAVQLKQAGLRIVAVPPVIEHHFEPSRLLYRAWKKRVRIDGRLVAYYQYHWFHGDVCFVSLRALFKTVQPAWFRFSKA